VNGINNTGNIGKITYPYHAHSDSVVIIDSLLKTGIIICTQNRFASK